MEKVIFYYESNLIYDALNELSKIDCKEAKWLLEVAVPCNSPKYDVWEYAAKKTIKENIQRQQ